MMRPTDSPAAADDDVAPLTCSAVLTHHWLVRRRGGERVLAALGELLPGSPIFTLVHDPAGLGDWSLARRPVHTSWLQRCPGARRHYPKLLPLMPHAARRMRLPPVDLVVCSDAALAKAMVPDARSRVVCYCHSPMRYVWDLADEYGRTLPALLRPLWPTLCARLRAADRAAAQRVDVFVANSHHVADRVRRHYGRDARVVYPPVDLPDADGGRPPRREDFLLCVGYHVPYKRLDLAVAAAAAVRRPLVVIGEGPDVARLRASAPGDVTWLGWQPDETILNCYRRAAALLFPGEEDFGIVPVEAMAQGCPVVAYGVGGAAETVVPDVTGVLVATQTVDALVRGLHQALARDWDPAAMRRHAAAFGRRRFLREMRDLLMGALEQRG